jgi:hypothetical protein
MITHQVRLPLSALLVLLLAGCPGKKEGDGHDHAAGEEGHGHEEKATAAMSTASTARAVTRSS